MKNPKQSGVALLGLRDARPALAAGLGAGVGEGGSGIRSQKHEENQTDRGLVDALGRARRRAGHGPAWRLGLSAG